MELLINLVKKKEFLYNGQSCKQFNDAYLAIMRDEAWQEIAKLTGKTKEECKSLWWSLRNDLKTAIKNRKTSWKGVCLPYNIKDFNLKYEKQMEFLLPYLEKPAGIQVLRKNGSKSSILKHISRKERKRVRDNPIPVEIIDITSENIHYETMNDVEKESNALGTRPPITKISCKKSKLMSDPSPADIITIREDGHECGKLCDECGELIIELDNEVITIPAKLSEANETDNEDSCIIRVKVRPTGDIDDGSTSSSAIPIDLDLDVDDNEGIDIKVRLEEIIGDINIQDEADLVADPLERSSDDQLNLVVKEKIAIPEKVCRCSSDKDDEESEQYYYSALAMAANQIDSYKVRLQLRKKITSVVMETVNRYISSKTIRQ